MKQSTLSPSSPRVLLLLGSLAAASVPVAQSAARASQVSSHGTPSLDASLAWGDANQDGRLDAVSVVAGTLHFFQGDPSGGLVDVTLGSGLEVAEHAALVAWGDYDADGAPDLFVGTAFGASHLFHNQGGRFVDVASEVGLVHQGLELAASWLDYDGDAHLDLELLTSAGRILYRGRADANGTRFERVDLPLGAVAAPLFAGTSIETSATEAGTVPATGGTPAPRGRASSVRGGGSSLGGSLPSAPSGPSLGNDPFRLPSALNALFVNDNANEVDSADVLDGSLTGADVSTSSGSVSHTGASMGLGTTTPDPDFALDIEDIGTGNDWKGGIAAGSSLGHKVVLGELDGVAAIGGHNATLDLWTPLQINPSGEQLTIGSQTPGAQQVSIVASGSTSGVSVDLDGTGTRVFKISTPSGHVGTSAFTPAGTRWDTEYQDSRMVMGTNPSPSGLAILTDGKVGIGTTSPTHKLTVQAGGLTVVDPPATNSGHAFTVSTPLSGNNIGFSLSRGDGAGGVSRRWDTYVPADDSLRWRDNNANADRLTIDTAGLVSVKQTLEIRGGADLVERFESSCGPLEPGTVVVIDPEHPGALACSFETYDSKVAGVVSGAGGVNPGICLSQEGVLDGEAPVAMTGRVYVKCSNENGAIAPGDLLTTAELAGYAMKATDSERSFGAVIGKAMSSLDEETGLVLVLVNLQ